MTLAGKPLNIPKFNIKGNGEAYQSWNNDQIIAIAATTFKWKPERFLVGDKSSFILLLIINGFSVFEVENQINNNPYFINFYSSIGAGIWEEIFFRLFLFGFFVYLLKYIFEIVVFTIILAFLSDTILKFFFGCSISYFLASKVSPAIVFCPTLTNGL